MPTTVAALARLVEARSWGTGRWRSNARRHWTKRPGRHLAGRQASEGGPLTKTSARAVLVPRDCTPPAPGATADLVEDVHRAVRHDRLSLSTAPPCRAHGRQPRGRHRSERAPGGRRGRACRRDDRRRRRDRRPARPFTAARILAGCKLGQNVTLYPNVVLYENTVIGDRTMVHAGSVVGGHGFGYRFQDGGHLPMAQLGWVRVGSDCEIGANSTIDRGTYGPP